MSGGCPAAGTMLSGTGLVWEEDPRDGGRHRSSPECSSKAVTAASYNSVHVVSSGPIELAMGGSRVGSSVAGLSARALATAANTVSNIKLAYDGLSSAYGVANCY